MVGLLNGALAGADLGGFCERLIALTGAAGITALAVGVLRRTPRHTETASIDQEPASR